MLYKIYKKIIFLLEPEKAHKVTLACLKILSKLHLLRFFGMLYGTKKNNVALRLHNSLDQSCQNNLIFKNRLGLAAGLDKNGDYLIALCDLGFGFIEVGTVTPKLQTGNPKPRLFRLPKERAIINRMGFNNKGIDYLLKRVEESKPYLIKHNTILGINIGKNATTSIEEAANDYLICFEKSYKLADYICINISSPNTANLRQLQNTEYLDNLLMLLKHKQLELEEKSKKYTPIALKIAPDLNSEEVTDICDLIIKYKIDILIATNTTNEHDLLYDKNNIKIAGGLSGWPLYEKSNQVLTQVISSLRQSEHKKNIIIIAVGGIESGEDAKYKLDLGADLVQVYTGLIYKGPGLIKQILSIVK